MKYLRIRIDGNFFVEEELKENKVIMKQDLTNVICIQIKRYPEDMCAFYLCFPHNVTCKYILNFNEFGYLLSNIIHFMQIKEEIDSIPLIFMHPGNVTGKIYGFSEGDATYEACLTKEIEEGILIESLDSRFQDLLIDAAINLNFKNVNLEGKLLGKIFEYFGNLLQIISQFENDPTSMQAFKNYYSTLGKNSSEPVVASGSTLYEIYLRFTPLLIIVRYMLMWRIVLPEKPIFEKQIDTFLALSRSQDPIMSILSSFALRTLFRVRYFNCIFLA